jgi:sulfoacetaldehyde dehydrogenase
MSINYEQYVSDLVAKARAAQAIAEGFTQERVDELTGAIAYALTKPDLAMKFGEMLCEESGMGIPGNKQLKMFNKVKGCYTQMKGKKSVGLYEEQKDIGITIYAKPMGVIGALLPITNGEATPVVKSLMTLKTRNAIIHAPHPKAAKTNWAVCEEMRRVLAKLGAPVDLIQAMAPEYVSIEASQELMKQCDFIVATGGTPMVKAAYSSGTPTIGVGTGNVVTIVDGTTNLDDVADLITRSKSFDHATSCSTENNIIVLESCYDAFIEAMAKKGSILIKENTPEKEKMLKALWPESPANHVLNRHIIAQSAIKIAEIAGVSVPADTKVIMVEENGGYGNDFPFTGEKLSPVAGIRKAKDFKDAYQKMVNIYNYMGIGHSCGIHTTDDERIAYLAENIHSAKVVVNAPQSLTNSGSWTTGLAQTMTIGCGTWGGNSISHSLTFKDLLNWTYVVRQIPSYQQPDDVLFDADIRAKVDA